MTFDLLYISLCLVSSMINKDSFLVRSFPFCFRVSAMSLMKMDAYFTDTPTCIFHLLFFFTFPTFSYPQSLLHYIRVIHTYFAVQY